jgi:hypothetical protein
MRFHYLIATVVLASLVAGCNGGGFTVSVITGPTQVAAMASADYSVTVSGATGVTYQWAVDPASAGSFANATSATATFTAAQLSEDTNAEIQVVVNADNDGPVFKKLGILITGVGKLVAGEIEGPDSIDEGVPVDFTISASGDTGITYQWSVFPDTAGTMENPTSETMTFTAADVDSDMAITIQVIVRSDNNDPVLKTSDVTLIDSGVNIPTPFGDFLGSQILDIAVESDGDVALASDAGLLLYSPYGIFKRTMSPDAWTGLATSNLGILDTTRGVMGVSPAVRNCNPTPSYDDPYVQGGVENVSYDAAWWAGEPDPYYPETCIDRASTSSFSTCDRIPCPIAYHPETAVAYQKVYAPDCVADSDCDWPVTNVIDAGGWAILAYRPLAPLYPDFMALIFEGGQDFLVYYDYPTYYNMQNAATNSGVTPACATFPSYIIWDLTDIVYMSDRDGMVAENIGDFELDALGRLIMAMPGAASVAITDPVAFGDPIVIQKILGGRQDDNATLPGEFRNPTAVAIDPRNQNILVSDTGNGRVQVFDSDGNFIRMFGEDDTTFEPGAIRVDTFGLVYVANVYASRPYTDSLRIYDEYGVPAQYGMIDGNVYDADSGLPIEYALVSIEEAYGPVEVYTDEDGYYVYPALSIGNYAISAEMDGYQAEMENAAVTINQRTVVDFNLNPI